ncbi:MAG: 1-acyl-sn-glycerol-3-phosphate acyltransferase [Acidobacteria bacterium]|nr:MAG: 1-acyl-sn-glycerol-3-phosphate acyltransferase [Acidobacteriota bacterium]PYQ79570.1 MAG: 1-acyl-sn-glycerol-3-phosphate acyltransferase [Acidobacteriota bacterium]PYQ84732.1 MAG: 1-acyl-sn-glycerol-3-phosphate acyltransferase [Acidobacteriota bacterium]PYR10860.1 MAG: 1-acyl-sn-glycerol-3-phosphate acyltransferase [Acidobacteriota bacterium]
MFIAAVRSLATYLAVSLYVLIAAPLGMALAILFGAKNFLYFLGHCGVRLALGLSGIKYRVAGAEHIPRDRAVVFCSNHQSNVDPPVLFEALHPRTHILYKAELNALPLLARAFRVGGFIPVDRRNKEAALRSIEAGAASLRAGNSFLIFPEGTRSRTAELLPFKKGGFIMAIKGQAPIVPVAVQGGRDAMRKGSRIVRPVTVSIRVGEPIETAGLTLDNRNALIAKTRERITALLAQGPV